MTVGMLGSPSCLETAPASHSQSMPGLPTEHCHGLWTAPAEQRACAVTLPALLSHTQFTRTVACAPTVEVRLVPRAAS